MAAEQRKVVVLHSGGMDSAVVLALALAEGHEVHALAFEYGQSNVAELVAARRCRSRVASYVEASVPLLGGGLVDGILCDAGEGEDSNGNDRSWVPGRNLVFFALAASYAGKIGAEELHVGIQGHAEEIGIAPDASAEFVECVQQSIFEGTGSSGPRVVVPLVSRSKREITSLGAALGVDFAQTVSCFRATSSGLACARCTACVNRREGFASAGHPDVTRYTSKAVAYIKATT